MRKTKKIIFIILIILNVVFLCGCSNNDKDQNIKKKVIDEIEYLDSSLISMLNELNNITFENYELTSKKITLNKQNGSQSQSGDSQSSGGGSSTGSSSDGDSQSSGQSGSSRKEITITQMQPNIIIGTEQNNIDWSNIKSQIETVNSAWSIIILDLYSINIDNNEILSFSSNLDLAIIAIKAEDKTNSLISLSKLYSYIPRFLNTISAENSLQNIKQTKSYIINAYTLVEQKNWEEISINIAEAEKSFKNVINDIDYNKDNDYKTNKVYILINELKNSIINQDEKLFYLKYKNLMEAINVL